MYPFQSGVKKASIASWRCAGCVALLIAGSWGCDDELSYSRVSTGDVPSAACADGVQRAACPDSHPAPGPVGPTNNAVTPDVDPVPGDEVPGTDATTPPPCERNERVLVELGHVGLEAPEGGAIFDVDVKEDRAWVTHERGVRVVDVADPTRPVLLGATDPPIFNAHGLAISNDKANRLGFLAVVGDGLRVIELNDDSAPVEIGAYDLVGAAGAEYANDVVLVGDVAYVAALAQGLWLIDGANARHPAPLGHCCVNPSAHPLAGPSDVDVVGELAVLADTEVGLRLIDIADPRRPVELASLPLAGPGRAIRARGGRAYVALDDAGLAIVDITHPASPTQLATLELPGRAIELELADGLVFVAAAEGGLLVVDPEAAEPVGARYPAAGPTAETSVSAVQVVGDRVYLADGEALHILTYTCPQTP